MAESYSVEAFLKANVGDFQKGFDQAGKQLEGFKQSAEKTEGTFQNGLSIGKIAAGIGLFAVARKGIDMVRKSVDKAFGRIDTMEQFERVMTTLTGSSEKANEVLGTVSDTVTGTAYGLDVGAKAVQGFVTSNMKVDKATETFGNWADAVAFYGDGTNATLGSVTDALAKATAKGKIQMDTMNSLAENGIPAMQIYADATGQSVEDVADAMSKGKIDATKFHKVMNKAISEGTKNFKSIEGAAKEAGASWTGSFDNMGAAIARGVIANIEKIDQVLTDNGLPDMRAMIATFGKQFENLLKKTADAIPKAIDKIKEFYESLKPWLPLIKGIAIGIGSFVGAIVTINTVIGIFGAVKKAILAVNAALFANPIVLIVAAIIAAAVLIYVYWEPISKFFIDLWEKIKVAGVAVWEWLKVVWANTVEWFKTTFAPLVEVLSVVWDNIKIYAAAAWELIKNVVLGAVLLLIDLLKGDFEGFKSHLSQIWENIKVAAETMWNAISNVFVVVWDFIKATVNSALDWIDQKTNGKFSVYLQLIRDYMTLISGVISDVWNFIKGYFNNALAFIKALVKGDFKGMRDAINAQMQNTRELIVSIWGRIKTYFSGALSEIWSNVKTKFGEIVISVGKKMLEVYGKIKDGWEKAKKYLTDIDLKQIGKDVIQGLIDGITSKVKAVGNAIKDVTSAITGKIKSILDIHSPSRVFMAFGGFISEGLAIGIEKMSSMATRAADALGIGVSDAFNPDLAMNTSGIADQINGINRQANRQIESHLTSELTLNKQPAIINVYVGTKRVAKELVDDISALQGRRVEDNAIYR